MNRRGFLSSCLAAAITGCGARTPAPIGVPPGELLGTDHEFGHWLCAPVFPAPSETLRLPVVIIGAGVGGLSAGWKLQRAGFEEFLIFELEREAGGNSRHAENAVCAYPWGAHYLPLPTLESHSVRELLADLGVLQGEPFAVTPSYDERFLCHAPQERLYCNGIWQEGLLPRLGVSRAERDQSVRFLALMAEFKARRDKEGRKAFALPIALSSRDPDLLALDRMTMREWMLQQRLDSPSLHWYVNHACRDDYGTNHDDVSAWAGIHYFACRDGEAHNASPDTVLTAPEGNGWIIRRLSQRLGPQLRTVSPVFRLVDTGKAVEADVMLRAEGRAIRIVADQAIWAGPAFVLPHVLEGSRPGLTAGILACDYAPWVVANLTLSGLPFERAGAPLAWDNVLYEGSALGYVVATHQNVRLHAGPSVFTYYHALSHRPPNLARQELLAATRETWAERILGELERPHPDIRRLTTRLDVFRYGHAMPRPVPGSIWHENRLRMQQGTPRLQFAHADVSGISLFEEANYRGVLAAERVLRRLGVRFATSLA